MKKILKYAGIASVVFLLLIALSAILLLKDGFKSLSISEYQVPEQNFLSWENVFANPSAIEVIAYNTAIMEGDRYPETDLNFPDRNAGYDVRGYIIRSEKHGDFLIDTGLDDSFFTNPPHGNSPLLIKFFLNAVGNTKFTLYEENNIAKSLKQYKVKPSAVFFTHLHFDHVAGVPALADDIKLVMDEKEINFENKAVSLNSYFKGKRNFNVLNFAKGKDMPVIGKCIDVFGDGSFWAISTPGHTSGHVSYIVNSKNGIVFISGDAVFFNNSLKYNLGHKKYDRDYDNAMRTRLKIIDFIKKYPLVKIYPGHESGITSLDK